MGPLLISVKVKVCPNWPKLFNFIFLKFPDISQESDSPFVFICKNPQEMIVKFPIKGNPKICKSQTLMV